MNDAKNIAIIEASDETAARYVVVSTCQSGAAAVRRARKTAGAVVIHAPEDAMTDECWYVGVAA
jgi:hypothetical protein